MVFLETKDHMGEIKAEMVFGNIVDVFLATLNFWRIGLEPMLTEARRHRASCDPSLMGRAFEDISGILQPYYDYQILHEERAKKISHVMGKNENFQQFIHVSLLRFGLIRELIELTPFQWAEKQEDSGRHKFKDLLSEPCTRLFKYTLLLERIAKYTRDAVVSSALQKMVISGELQAS